jgi:alpha-tubulin suppressor-like RCC1 family protein
MLHAAAGGDRMCALNPDRALLCIGTLTISNGWIAPAPQPGVWLADATLAQLSVSLNHDCYLTSTGKAYCQGENALGQLGVPVWTNRDSALVNPVAVAGGLIFAAITTGTDYSCGLTGTRAYCWGAEALANFVVLPTPVAGDFEFSAIDAGDRHTCGISVDGSAYCWGDNTLGQLGDGTRTSRPAPVAVAGGQRYRSISASADHTCGLTTDGILYCWGANDAGQLGDGSTSDALAPVKVAYQP